MPASLSVSIVTFAPPRHPDFDRVLDHLFEAVEHARRSGLIETAEVTIIDNGTNDFTQYLSGPQPENIALNIISNRENAGYSAHNQAILPSSSDIHLVLNPDVLLSVTALTAGISYLGSNPESVMICPYSTAEDGSPSYLCKRYPAVTDLMIRGFAPGVIRSRFDDRLMTYEYRDQSVDQVIESVELVSGCCMLARTNALQACKGFDSTFFLYFEDFDLSLRMSQLGRLDYCPDMRITHFGGNAATKGLKHILYFVRSAIRFYRKHGLKIF